MMSTDAGSCGWIVGQQVADGLGDLDGVRAGLAEDGETTVALGTSRPRTQKRMSMRSSCTVSVRVGDVPQVDRRAVLRAR